VGLLILKDCEINGLSNKSNEITIKLNNKLDQLNNENIINQNNNIFDKYGNKNILENYFLIIKGQDYEYYKLGIKYYKNIHHDKFYKNSKAIFEPKTYEEQLNILNQIFISFNSAKYYFNKILIEYPKSEWAEDSKDKLKLLKIIFKSYVNMNIEENNQIINSSNYVKEMGLNIM